MQQVALEAGGDGPQSGTVVVVHQPGVDTDRLLRDGPRQDPGAFEGLPRDFQQQALLHVDGERFARAHPEERRVELVGLKQEPTLADVAFTRAVRVGVVEVLVPAAGAREGSHRVLAGSHQPPQILRGPHAAGIAAGHADDRDRLPTTALELPKGFAGLVEIRRHPLQVGKDLLVVRHLRASHAFLGRGSVKVDAEFLADELEQLLG